MMKWKYFFLTWLVIFLLAPSIWIHRLFMYQTPPPGSDLPGPELFIPFGGVYYFGELAGQLSHGDFMDAAMIFLFLVLPIVIYTFFLSLGIYHLGKYILKKLQDRRREKTVVAP